MPTVFDTEYTKTRVLIGIMLPIVSFNFIYISASPSLKLRGACDLCERCRQFRRFIYS